MKQIQRLYQLQSLDRELDKAKQQLAEISVQLGESQALKNAKKAIEVAERDLQKCRTTMQDLELEVKTLTDKITNQEKMLYGGKALSAKEASNLQDEVASLKRWHSKREELLLEAMVETEEAEEKLNHAQTELSRVQAEWTGDQADLVQSQNILEAKVAELMEQRPSITQTIEAGDLNEYEDLRPLKAGVAVVAVKDSVCQGCGMAASNSKIQQARAGEALIYCGGCGRILYVS